MSRIKDLTGQRFGRLVVVKRHPITSQWGNLLWECQCDCGKTSVARSNNLIAGKTASCGCGRVEHHITHGKRHSPEYYAWANMIQRCTTPTNPGYAFYGGRGIKVCDEWLKSFEVFYADMGPRPSADHSVERRDVNGNYESSNCFWATKTQQNNNTRRNVYYEFGGRRITEAQLAHEHGLSQQTLRGRLARGMTLEEALAKPVRVGWSKGQTKVL